MREIITLQCNDCKNRIRSDPKSPGLQNLVAGQIVIALIWHYTEKEGPPKTIV